MPVQPGPPGAVVDGSVFLIGSTPSTANSALTGRYRPTGGHNGFPFYTLDGNASVKLHHSRGRWWVGKQVDRSSGYMYVEDGAPMPDQITATWMVYDGGWRPAPQLRCVASDPLAPASEAIFLIGHTPGGVNSLALGRYVRTGELRSSRNVYRNDTQVRGGSQGDGSQGGAMYIFYAIGSWWVSRTLPSGNSAAGLLRAQADEWLPEQLPSGIWTIAADGRWAEAPDVLVVTNAPSVPDVHSDGRFLDSEFPPAAGSLGLAKGWQPGEVDAWVRSETLVQAADGGKGSLFDDIGPDDLLQGALGNCWLLASLACVAEFPELIESLFLENERSSSGSYTLRFFSAEVADWQAVTIDNTIPATWGWGHPTPCFANAPPGGDEWAMLIEKGVAKFCGSFAELHGGSTAWALQLLLGPDRPVECFNRIDGHGERWSVLQLEVERLAASGQARSPSGVSLVGQPGDTITLEELWEKMASADIAEHVITTGGVEKVAGQPQMEVTRSDELVTDHAYSILRATSVGGHRLLQLRNPWGNAKEWRGAWGDHSSLWQQQPDVVEAVGFSMKDDGTFWMAYQEWADLFTTLTICSTSAARRKAEQAGTFATSRAGRGKQAREFGRLRPRQRSAAGVEISHEIQEEFHYPPSGEGVVASLPPGPTASAWFVGIPSLSCCCCVNEHGRTEEELNYDPFSEYVA